MTAKSLNSMRVAALLAAVSLATLAQAQTDRYDALANSPMAENLSLLQHDPRGSVKCIDADNSWSGFSKAVGGIIV